MLKNRITLVALVIAVGGLASQSANAEPAKIMRTDLVQNEISIKGHEAVQVRVDFEPGAVSVKHTHPGEEVAYVLKGSLEYHLEGRDPVTLHAGDALFIPSGVAHIAKNVGDGEASELATYIVEKGVPQFVPVQSETD